MAHPTSVQPITTAQKTGNTLKAERGREALTAYLFLLPTFLGFFIFVLGPLLYAMYLSMTRYDVLTPPTWIGLGNYRALLSDTKTITSFQNTGVFVIVSTLLEILIALLLAVGVNRRMPVAVRYVFRTSYFLPIITSGAAVAIIFGYMFNPDFGVINYYLSVLGFEPIPWITSTRYSLSSIILASVWQRIGFTFIVFTAGLQNIPRDLYEAADVDGAGEWTKFIRITVPLLSPTILFSLVIGIIGSLQVFEIPLLMTNGGPGDSSRTVVMVIQEEGFRNLAFGYASAIAVVLFFCIMVLTLIQFWLSRRWVHYQ